MKAKEAQNQIQFDNYNEKGGVVMGPYTTHIWRTDPRHLGFLLARYKFCSKMLTGKGTVLEVGCGDSFGTGVILQTVEKVHCVDFEPLVIEDNVKRNDYGPRCTYEVIDMTRQRPAGMFDAAFSLDVIEHVPSELENVFMKNICSVLNPNGICIMGTPNISAQQYASEGSSEGHINLKSEKTLRTLMADYFHTAFLFSMNDEVVHTGYYPMAHYLIAVGVGQKNAG